MNVGEPGTQQGTCRKQHVRRTRPRQRGILVPARPSAQPCGQRNQTPKGRSAANGTRPLSGGQAPSSNRNARPCVGKADRVWATTPVGLRVIRKLRDPRGAPRGSRIGRQRRRRPDYLSSIEAPAASRVSLAFSASSLEAPSRTALGAPSTRSLASFSPRFVSARTSLMT